jgi:hypothetical protein
MGVKLGQASASLDFGKKKSTMRKERHISNIKNKS